MMRKIQSLYQFECRVFQEINSHFDKRILNLFFRTITQIGGALFISATTLLLIILTSNQTRLTAISSAFALALSHIPVQLVKKLFPRKRPYLQIETTKILPNPLKDHSFPSGHTTAVFSVIVPFLIQIPPLAAILLPIGLSVAISRIYLGLHYPSDVIAGGILGACFGSLCFYLLS
ncbi:phosphatase PAP2 family protein [Neobacillus niacini]|jgi:undecaprenyl-diphosphatase|uniref:phosphatase PAP2 family protein n=1 Tax=Neobacillus niacini TaxID=86668 RepID=UPI001C8D1858|nr:phosphatase PAP2 family protein [Neobacillus niacini]MBY0147594.1 phosphatase PAP2 family protein [Neobacillus niacini]